MTDSNKAASEDFLWQFEQLQDDRHQVRMVGRRPEAIDTIAMAPPEQIYRGRNAQEALRLALAWNSEGLNIEFEVPNLKDCLGCKWIALQAHVDYRLASKLSVLRRIIDINKEEFHGKANIFDAGDAFWFLIRMPDHIFKTSSESLRFMESVRDYSMNLGIRWDISTPNDLAFCIDAIDFFPAAGMPAAGMLRHGMDSSRRTGWLSELGESPQQGFVDQISQAMNFTNRMGQKPAGRIGSDIMRNAALMKINSGFTQDSFFRLLKNNGYFRKVVFNRHLAANDNSPIAMHFDLILFLRSHWFVGPGMIELGIVQRNEHVNGTSHGSQYYQRVDVFDAMLSADEHKTQVTDNSGMIQANPTMARSGTFDLSSIPTSFRELSIEEVMEELTPKYGPNLHFPSNGWFLLQSEGPPSEAIHVKEHPSRVRPYIPFPCHYWILANMEVLGNGAILVPNANAKEFWLALNRKKIGQSLAAIYFWHYGTRFAVDWVPVELTADRTGVFHRVMSWLASNESRTWKIWKAHSMDHGRYR